MTIFCSRTKSANNEKKMKKTRCNTVHIAGRGLVVRQLRILASQFRVLRTGTLSEIRPDNMYQPLGASEKDTTTT
jgi:hypothetical protein